MTRHTSQVIFAAVIALLAGMLLGRLITHQRSWSRWNPQQRQQRMLQMFSQKLNLTSEQRQQVAKILESGHRKMESLHDQVRPQFEALRTETHERIRALLTPEQAQRFAQMEQQFSQRRAKFQTRRQGGERWMD